MAVSDRDPSRWSAARLLVFVVLVTMACTAVVLVAGQAGPNESAGYTLDGDSVYWEIPGKGRITVSPHTSHGRWDAVRYQNIEFESYLGTDENVTCGIAFNQNPKESGLSLQKQRTVQVPVYDVVTNASLGYGNVTEDYWQDVTAQLTAGKKSGKFFGYGTFAVPAYGKKTFQVRYLLNESEIEDENGRKKWEMRCWQGSFTSPTWEINLDPWADNLTCVAYYSFDNNQTSGTTAVNWQDCSLGNATVKAGVTTGLTGQDGEAYNFTGAPNVMVESASNVDITGAMDRTLGGWIYARALTSGSTIIGWGCTFDNLGCPVRANSYLTLGGSPVGQLYFSSYAADCSKNTSIAVNTWQHVAATVNNSGQTINIYQNGTKIKTCTGPALNTTTTPLGIGDNSSNRYRSDYSLEMLAFDGVMDDMFVFATALTDSQIKAIYANGTKSLWSAPPPNPDITSPTTLTPDPAYTTSTITAFSNYTESTYGSNGTVYGSWHVDGITIYSENFTDVAHNTQVNFSLGPENFTKHQSVNFSVYAESGGVFSDTKWSNTLEIQNSPPEVDLFPLEGMPLPEDTFNDTVLLSGYVTDADASDTSHNWSCMTNESAVSALAYNDTKRFNISATGDFFGSVNVTCTADDGDGGAGGDSFTLAVLSVNDPPTHGTPLLASTSGKNFTSDNLTCHAQNVQDIDGDPVQNITAWYADGMPLEILLMPFEGGSTAAWTRDYSTGAHNGTVTGATWGAASGKLGGAYTFDGVDDSILVLDDDALDSLTSLSVFFWARPVQSKVAEMIVKHLNIDSDINWEVFQSYQNIAARVAGAGVTCTSAGNLFTMDSWHYVGMTWNGTHIATYVDGIASTACNRSVSMPGGKGNLSIGRYQRGVTNYPFNGTIDEVRVYGRALTPEQVRAHYELRYDVLTASETAPGTTYGCALTPNDGEADGLTKQSNTLEVRWAITFNVTSSELDLTDIPGVSISCDYGGFDQGGDTSNVYGPFGFAPGDWVCTFTHATHYPKTVTFTANEDRRIEVIMNEAESLTDQEHFWLEDIYNCLYDGNCKGMALWENINKTTTNTWNQFKRTDESVVAMESITNNVVNATNNLTISYRISVPTKEDYQFLPMRLYYWFLNAENTTCYDQVKDTHSAEKPSCHPFVAETVGRVSSLHNFTVELRPNVPASGNYTVIRRIEIDPPANGLPEWINYGHEAVGTIEVTEVSGEGSVMLHEQASTPVEETTSLEQVIDESEGEALSSVTGLVTEKLRDGVLTGEDIVVIVKTIAVLLTFITLAVCLTIYGLKRGGR